MPIYKGSTKIADTGKYGLYIGGQRIGKVYKGNRLVYQYHPYSPSQVIVYQTGRYATSFELPFGVYNVAICGGGGNGTFDGYISGAMWSSSGSSGAAWEGQIYVSRRMNVNILAGEGLVTSYLDLGGSRFITAGAGGNGRAGGGVISVNNVSGVEVLSTSVSANGVAGYQAPGATSPRLSSSTYGWGASTGYNTGIPAGHVQQGGIRLQFVRRYR